ncbi:MAG TPA: carbohydrate ABC transporter permease [Candidatus Ornithospirochaeta avicola]|uniref:sn-glycerol-3-phosphate transport system permease protein UgpE n=1 Tax=Candidatus Ornithospirochaeta avicola TaxID=2840896 RepID=A0A9D1PSH0_9SPIO|nr:carbohydrate ABC transporter permease [Candidatus Ornithospirochaeta avicola]
MSEKEVKVRSSLGKNILGHLPGYILVFIWVAFTAVILFWILGASLSTTREIFSGSVLKFESGLHFENYANAWSVFNVSVYFANSLLYSIVTCVVVIIIAAPAAYAISRYKFPGNKALKTALIVCMSVPAIMVILPLYSLTAKIGFRGRLLLIFLYIFSHVPYTTVFLLNFFGTLSRTYEEAAAIDGCPAGRTFWQIMLPLTQPAIITVSIFTFLGVWNEFFMAMIFATSSSSMPVGVGLLQIVNSMKYTMDYGGLFAAVIIVFLPTFLLYVFLSEKIISGVTGGGIKG